MGNTSNHHGFTYEQALNLAERRGETVIPGFCSMCGPNGGCGMYAFIKNGKLIRVAGMAEAPRNKGSLCAKGLASAQWLYSPDRLKYPLIRKGKKGEGIFEKISWDDAISIIADKLSEQKKLYGPESLAILAPALRTYNPLMQRFLTVHGSPNYGHSGICAMQRMFGFSYTIGGYPVCDYEHSDLIVYWARQPVYSGPATEIAKSLVRARQRGAQIITIKPSLEADGDLGSLWLPIRPGTDAALALSMLNVVINEDLIDHEFVKNWCFGFDQLHRHIQQYTPEWAEKICGITAEKIKYTARLYAQTKAAAIDVGNGVEHAPSSCDAIRAIAMLMAITGHLNRPGCNIVGQAPGTPSPAPLHLNERYTKEMVEKLVAPEFPKAFQPFMEGTSSAYFRIFESVITKKPYPIRTIIAPGTQPLVSTRGSKIVMEALKQLDFFVTVDVTRPAEMNYADIVLPTTTPYESDYPFEAQGPWIMARQKMIEPLGDYKSIYEFVLDLAVKMGYGSDFWNGNIEAMEQYRIKPFQITLEELREHPTGILLKPQPHTIPGNYKTIFSRKSPRLAKDAFLPHTKVALYNTLFEQEGFEPMPVWREPPESLTGTPQLARRYPLILTDYHTTKSFTASWQRNVPSLREIQKYPTVHIHPDTASVRGIHDGDWVKVESPHGWLKVKAELYPGIRPDTVMIQHGWWQGCQEMNQPDMPILDGGANVNHLYNTDPNKAYDPLVTAMSSQTLVEVSLYEK